MSEGVVNLCVRGQEVLLLFQCLSLALWNLDVAIALSVTRGILSRIPKLRAKDKTLSRGKKKPPHLQMI